MTRTRKSHTDIVSRLRATGRRSSKQPPKNVARVIKELRGVAGDLQHRAASATSKRSAAAKKGAATRKRGAAKRGIAARKGMRTRAKRA